MISRFDFNPLKITLLLAYSLALFLSPPLFADNNAINMQIGLLEDEFRSLSSKFYKDTSVNNVEKLRIITDIDQLHAEVNHLIGDQRSTRAIQLLRVNINTINNNIDHKALFDFTELLLEKNEWNMADTLLSGAQNEGDKYSIATMQFIFAKYYASRNEWDQVNKLLDGMFSELSLENASYAYLLDGVALQNLKKHRQAIGKFNKVPTNSEYYAYAQLNTAIANIRQGWWTDAQKTINDVINFVQKDNSDELINRLYLVLGYALLQKEYYRDARDAFRNIGLDSRYTNRALLGIGLTATSQGDFVGGLNALSILKEKPTFDLSVDESYLLIPYVYEQLQQEITVAASYTDALSYYQRRMDNIELLVSRHSDFLSANYNEETSSITINNNSLDYGKWYPGSFISNYRQLIELSSATKNDNLKSNIEDLISKHDAVFQKIIAELFNLRKEYLKSYLNQSRYGLARLYDKSNETAN